jgi:hypothetical protein
VAGAFWNLKRMARPNPIRDLEPLPRPSALGTGGNNAVNLRNLLRSIAVKNQREQPRVFYSLREVARQFKVPISAVSRVYHDMEEEGLLSRVRASKTVLNGLRYHHRRVRAIVALPARLSTFITIPDYRAFLNSIRRELWFRGFSTTMVFYRAEEAANGNLSDELKRYEVDAVIWAYPGRSGKESFLRLADMGIRVATISEVGTPTLPSRYYVWKETAMLTILSDWKRRHSPCKVTVVDCKEYRAPVIEELLRVLLEGLQIEATIRTFSHHPIRAFLGTLCRVRTHGVIIPSASLASMFAFQDPEGLTNLLKTQRVALMDGPVDVPFAKVPDTAVDLVTVDWKAVGETIVNDLVTLEAFDRNRHTTFEAQAQLKVPFSGFCEPIRPFRSIAGGI